MALDGVRYIANPVTGPCCFDPLLKCFTRDVDQVVLLIRRRTGNLCHCIIAVVTVNYCATIHGYQVARLNDPVARNSVNNLFIYRNTRCCREPVQPQESGFCPLRFDGPASNVVEFTSRNSLLQRSERLSDGKRDDPPGLAHKFQLLCRL